MCRGDVQARDVRDIAAVGMHTAVFRGSIAASLCVVHRDQDKVLLCVPTK
jgi:hypothetical protein